MELTVGKNNKPSPAETARKNLRTKMTTVLQGEYWRAVTIRLLFNRNSKIVSLQNVLSKTSPRVQRSGFLKPS
ncbi:unnamed protein product [Allacma fusca]|uniref:Uncharacterized protein n=1 Tax=Allacma fusca TaxID=39272 RepID=A0A8J2KEU1_9HEXA|nr:unnamed protein product [Allacma fusca]